MKKLITKILGTGCLGILVIAACKKDGSLITATSGSAGALTATSTTLVLDKTKVNDVTTIAETFNFTQGNFGYNAAVTNTLQFDKPGDNWANPISVVINPDIFTQAYTTPAFNAIALKLGIAGGTAGTFNVRVMESIGTSTTPIYSNILTVTVTPFNLTSYLYAVGAFEGWNLSNVDSLVSVTGNGIYAGIINFTAGNNQWLLLPQKNNYNNKYATNDNGPTNTTVAQNANNNLYAPSTAGQYLVTFNSNSNTINYALSDYYSVIGDGAQGWSTDVPMKYVNDGAGNWVLTANLVSTGSFKIRQDNGWSQSWGIPNSGSAGYGVANTLNNSSNSNIPVPVSGSYTVTFNAPATVFGAPALATTTYTSVKH